jgi:hypothetical protein
LEYIQTNKMNIEEKFFSWMKKFWLNYEFLNGTAW